MSGRMIFRLFKIKNRRGDLYLIGAFLKRVSVNIMNNAIK